MAKTSVIPKDLIPYRAGVVVVTVHDQKLQPVARVATEWDFLTSTQTTVTRTTESLPNGNGQDKEYIQEEIYNVTVVGNTFNPVFHAAVAGRIEELPAKCLVPKQFTHRLPATVADGGVLEITFGEGKDAEVLPAADSDGTYNFIVEDGYKNTLVQRETPELGAYTYDADTHALQFSEDYKGEEIRVIYWWESTNSVVYTNNPVIQQPILGIEIFGTQMSASTDEKVLVTTKLLRATSTGDLSDQITQKAKSAPITYNFKSAPVPEGVSNYSQTITPIDSSTSGAGNIVNGGDDDFSNTTKPGGGIGDDIDQGEV